MYIDIVWFQGILLKILKTHNDYIKAVILNTDALKISVTVPNISSLRNYFGLAECI